MRSCYFSRLFYAFGIVFVCLLLNGCNKKNADSSGPFCYFVNAKEDGLVSCSFNGEGETSDEFVRNMLVMLSNEQKGDYKALVTDPNRIRFHMEGNVLCFDSPFDFEGMYSDCRDSLYRLAVVKSFCSSYGIDTVRFAGDSIGVNPEVSNETPGYSLKDFADTFSYSEPKQKVRLYYADSNREGLLCRECEFALRNDSSLPVDIVNKLLEGSKESNMIYCFSDSVNVKSVLVKNRICYVDFDRAFADETSAIPLNLSVYSLVNSLTGLQSIDGVVISVNGERFTEGTDIDTPYLTFRPEFILER